MVTWQTQIIGYSSTWFHSFKSAFIAVTRLISSALQWRHSLRSSSYIIFGLIELYWLGVFTWRIGLVEFTDKFLDLHHSGIDLFSDFCVIVITQLRRGVWRQLNDVILCVIIIWTNIKTIICEWNLHFVKNYGTALGTVTMSRNIGYST